MSLLGKYPGFKETYTTDGRAPRKGEVFRNSRLAATLEKIAAGGRDAFYKGDIARAMDAYMKRNGGFLSYLRFGRAQVGVGRAGVG